MTIKSKETIAAEEAARLRSQKRFSTDPDRLEHEAQQIERRAATKFLCNMPGDGPWKMKLTIGGIMVVSDKHGAFHLEVTTDGRQINYIWHKVSL